MARFDVRSIVRQASGLVTSCAVAAGTFRTWVVEQSQEITQASGARLSAQRTVWYSPQVKTFVQTR